MNAETIETVAVLGLGTMGHGMAQIFAAAGCAVRCYDENAAARGTAVDRIRGNLDKMVEAGITDAESIPRTLERIQMLESESEAVASAQFVVEAISEELAPKQELFARIEPLVGSQAIMASNSSSFPITESAAKMQRPERAIVTHWFNPPHIVPLVEVVPGEKTDEAVTQATVDFHRRVGKLAVRVNKEVPGFLVNRVQVAIFREIFDLLDRGVASAEDIDQAIRGSIGLRLAALGPFQVMDFAGLDITSRTYENLVTDIRSDTEVAPVIRRLVDEGNFGTKTGKGIYDYTPESIEQKQKDRDRKYLALAKLLWQNLLS